MHGALPPPSPREYPVAVASSPRPHCTHLQSSSSISSKLRGFWASLPPAETSLYVSLPFPRFIFPIPPPRFVRGHLCSGLGAMAGKLNSVLSLNRTIASITHQFLQQGRAHHAPGGKCDRERLNCGRADDSVFCFRIFNPQIFFLDHQKPQSPPSFSTLS